MEPLREVYHDNDTRRREKRDTICTRAATRLLPTGVPKHDEPGSGAWTRVVHQHRASSKAFTQTEIARRWRGEVALDALDAPSRSLVTLGRDEVVDGAPNADEIPHTLECRTIRINTMDSWNSPDVFWGLCHDHVTRTAATTSSDSFAKAVDFQARFQTLASAMDARGVSMRSDSRLCAQYVDGTLDMGTMDVVDTMEEMTWLYTATSVVDYGSIREDCFETELRLARDEIGWLTREEMRDVGDIASEHAKEMIALRFAYRPELREQAKELAGFIPRLMERRIQSHQTEVAKERGKLLEQRRSLFEAFATGTLCELAFVKLGADKLAMVPPCVLDGQFDSWFSRRKRASAAFQARATSRAMAQDLVDLVRRATKVAVMEMHGQWVPVGQIKGKDISATRSIARWLGLFMREDQSGIKKVKTVTFMCERASPFESLTHEDWCPTGK